MFEGFRRRLAKPVPITASVWARVLRDSALLHSLTGRERAAVRELAGAFLHRCRLVGAHGFAPDAMLRARVAGEACTLLLGLPAGLDAFRAVRELVLYPSGFRVTQRWTDEDGVAHEREAQLAGEAWQEGPVILARDDVERPAMGFNVVVHEFAHVLDAGNGVVNGFPEIRDARLRHRWPAVFQEAFDALQQAERQGLDGPIDPYALEDPGEFFAVASESFFTDPVRLADAWPEVYRSLADYFGQSPKERFTSHDG